MNPPEVEATIEPPSRKPFPVVIDEEFHSLCPPLSGEEREGLRDSLSKDGLLSPLVVWRNKDQLLLIDGHNRFEIIEELGGQDYAGEPIEIITKELFFGTRENAHNWIITNQLARRNLSSDAASLLRGKLYNSRKGTHGGDRKSKGQNDPLQTTAAQIAKETGVSEKTVKRDAVFASAAEKVGATTAIMAGTETRSRKEIIEEAKPAVINLSLAQQAAALKVTGPEQHDVDDTPLPSNLTQPKKRESRIARWNRAAADAETALSELYEIQQEYQDWHENLPENLQDSALAEKLQMVNELDIESALSTAQEATSVELPLGFGRD